MQRVDRKHPTRDLITDGENSRWNYGMVESLDLITLEINDDSIFGILI